MRADYVISLPIASGAEVEYRGFWLKRLADRRVEVTLGDFREVGVTVPHAIAIVDRFHWDH